MKYNFSLLLVFLISISAQAQTPPSFKVLLRQEMSTRTYYKTSELKDLEGQNSFNGKYFKIVLGKSNDAISFAEKDETLLLKAANVYYHLTLARDYWVNQVKSQVAQNLPQLIIRIDIKNQFDELGHFGNDNRTPQFNNALSIPDGQTPDWVPSDRQDSWNKEIWFRPKKSVLTKDLGSLGPNPITQSLQAVEQPLISYTQNQFTRSLMENVFYPTYVSRPLHEDVIRLVGTIAITKIIIQGSKHADRLFIDKYYYLETAMIPEIVYHEYSHIVLSDHLEMSHSTPVNEGMADYFAASMSNKRKVYAKVPGHSNSASKDTQSKKIYSHLNESSRQATADFTLSVLWDVRELLGEEIADKVVYEARTFLKTETATISDHLLRAILNACESQCEQVRRDKLKLLQAFKKKGF